MSTCLKELSDELNDHGLAPGKYSVHGLSYENGCLTYCWDSVFKEFIDIEDNFVKLIEDIDENIDPCPLLLVFTDEDCYNPQMRDFYRKILIEQIRAYLLCNLHNTPLENKYTITSEEILLKVTDGIFEYLGKSRQENLKKFVKVNIFNFILNNWTDKQEGIKFIDRTLLLEWKNESDKNSFLNWLEDKHTLFDTTKPVEEQLSFLGDEITN